MSKKILVLTALIYATCLLQSTVLGYVEIHGIRPNLLLIVAISVALIRSDWEAATIGLVCGLGMDILVGRALGWYGISLFLVCFLIGQINSKLYRENPLIPVFFVFTSSIVIEMLCYLIIFFLKGYEDFVFVMTNLILPESLYNAVLSFPVFKLIERLYKKIDKFTYIHNRV